LFYLKRETWIRLDGHHMPAGSTRYRRNIPAHPNPITYMISGTISLLLPHVPVANNYLVTVF
jgi:hypothetical protein